MTRPSLYQIFLIFLQLGCFSFGGPAAHLVFFHRKFVMQLKWIDDPLYGQLVALAHLLPGPSSSQVGLSIGYLQRGYAGALMAWLGFTLPSAMLMTGIALLGQHYFYILDANSFHTLQLVVFAVIAWAFWQMLNSLCKTAWQYAVVLISTLLLVVISVSFNQLLVILLGAISGLLMAKSGPASAQQPNAEHAPAIDSAFARKSAAPYWLLIFIAPFFLLPLIVHFTEWKSLQFFADFYQTGSLVFGGGHVVLPLLYQDFVATHLVSGPSFDLGYAFAQLMPGPLFSFASYVGALLPWTAFPWLNALLATCAIFLPSFLLVFAALPYWSWLMQQRYIQRAVSGINAAVVGLLLYLLLDLSQRSFRSWSDLLFVLLMMLLLRSKLPVWASLISGFIIYQSYLHYF
ncbi:chromate efflux transporter [Acinetobacter sp. RF14B]|uniref:chromate efflux transporter n=1 Tax=Acinetobacter sp. RF14B TaxID=2650965 RepID=UPI00116A34F2|nr:chromate efflux transporter [Acinetobacter sp. RF14B]TQR65630.1 chromate efflux transporter [Acinetobacter sp. RF14B]